MSAQDSSSSEAELSDSEEEVPVVELCRLPLARLLALDLSTTEDFSSLLTILANEGSEKAYVAVMRIRKLLSNEANPPIQEVISAGGVEILHKAMKHEDERIRLEATWAITNLLSGNSQNTTKVLKSGCIATLVDLMNGEDSWGVKEQALWAFGNIAGDSTLWRDQVLEAGGLTAILSNLNENSRNYMKQACWVVSNMVRGRPPPDPMYQIQAAPFVLSHLSLDNDSEINCDLLWALSYVTEKSLENIEINQGNCELLVKFMSHAVISVSLPALRTIGNIISSTEAFTSVFLGIGILGKMNELLDHPKKNMRRETCWVLSNICAESNGSVQQVVFSGILPKVITLALEDDFPIRKEAMWVLANICDHCSLDIKPQVLKMGIATPLTEGLESDDSKVRKVCIEGLTGVFKDIKELMGPEAVLELVSVNDIMEKCKELASQGITAAKGLMQEIAWLTPNDNDLGQ